VLVLKVAGFREALGVTASSGTYGLLSPDSSPPPVDAGVYYHVPADVSIVQVMFMGGIAVALFGVLGLAPGLRELGSAGGRASLRAAFARGDGWTLRAVTAVLIACGVAASVTAFALAGTARPDTATGGWAIPALHSTASDQPVPVTQSCTSRSGFQVCVHQAFSFYLDDVAAALAPVAAEIAGLPGAPARAEEVASVSDGNRVMRGISGNPPVFDFTAEHVGTTFGEFYGFPDPAGWRDGFQQGLLDAFLEGQSHQALPVPLTAAQQAVEDVLLTAVGSPPLGASSGQTAVNGKLDAATLADISAAAHRFAALSASARHAWLATHLTALRAGTVTLAQLP
jgi:hypothetical protein